MTPEGKVKREINKVLKRYKLYSFMPVPSGYGPSSLDYLLCVNGLFVAIEAKAPGKEPTPRQEVTIEQILGANGITFVIDGPRQAELLDKWLSTHAPRNDKS